MAEPAGQGMQWSGVVVVQGWWCCCRCGGGGAARCGGVAHTACKEVPAPGSGACRWRQHQAVGPAGGASTSVQVGMAGWLVVGGGVRWCRQRYSPWPPKLLLLAHCTQSIAGVALLLPGWDCLAGTAHVIMPWLLHM